MKRASKLLSEEEIKAVNSTVAEAESSTSAEIVPVVATASGRYDRAEDIFGVLVALLVLALVWVFVQEVHPVEGDWASGRALTLGLVPVLLIAVGGFILGTAVASHLPVLRLPFITKSEMRQEVDRRAAEAFYRFRVRRTKEGTGVLIYISLYERMVRVLADDTISQRLTQRDWDTVRDLVIRGIRADRAAEGLSQAILKCGELLKPHFPSQVGDINELPNEIQFLD